MSKQQIKPQLDNRVSRCICCEEKTPSSWLLPFFEYRPLEKEDRHYCGCQEDV